MEWYYSDKLKLYISLEPLKIDNRVFRAAKKHNISLDWDDYGNVVMLDFAEFKTLVSELGGVILSPSEYWQLYHEACEKDCQELKNSLMSSQFTEILDRVYVDNNTYIDHCEVVGEYKYQGDRITYESVVGRPGWISVDDIDINTGHPLRVHKNDPDKAQMKYWSPDLANVGVGKAIALRGYVTSVAMPSLDLGIPADTRQPKMMVRFCTAKKPKELEITQENNSGIELTYDHFKQYILSSQKMLDRALKNEKIITFVTGHKNPDTDTIVSSALEAFCKHLSNCDEDIVYLPLVQGQYMPKEIEFVLGQDISDSMIYSDNINLSELLQTGKIRFIFTDQNYQKEYQKYVVSIIDHHSLNKELEDGTLAISCNIEMLGSCTALIVKNCLEKGFDFDSQLSFILYSAMLMDTENCVSHKMTSTDEKIMEQIQKRACVESNDTLYESIMSHLISETDGEKLYRRDYKHYYGFGFSVLKVTDMIDKPELDEWLEMVISLAKEDNIRNNDYFTIVKLVDYEAGGLQVNKERLYCVWNNKENPYLIEKLQELIYKVVQCCMPDGNIERNEHYIEISNTGKQLSRKQIVPAIEALVSCCGQFSYIDKLGKWVAKDFLKVNRAVKSFYPEVFTDAKGRVCNISFVKAKELLENLGMGMLSLKEYWQVYEEANKKQDSALLSSLVDKDFLEFLDTCCIDGVLVHSPVINGSQVLMSDDTFKVEILYANPGLISPAYIDKVTGLPNCIFNAANYHDKSLWRYWSPLSDKIYVFSRSYIFLLQQPCLDAKSTPEESFVNVGIRPIRDSNLKVDVKIELNNKSLFIKYKSEYDDNYEVIYELLQGEE